ncbi:MAG TPA: CHRD domain-containing protein [Gaiellaceae bacterium]|nr:CHRD domain-containing protein [Gaiellaceae bacterium]
MPRRLRLFVLAAAAASALALGSYALAAAVGTHADSPGGSFHANLTGYQETPAVSSTGSGHFRATRVEEEKLHYVFTYEGLEGGASLFAHVHFGQRSVAGMVSFFLCGGSTKPDPCPNVAGRVEGDITPADVIGPSGQGIEPGSFAEIVKAMRAGIAYVNIHTTRWPGGEIRGQITRDAGD